MPIDIYSMKLSPPCRAVLMTARQLNIDLNVKTVDLTEGDQLKPEYIKLNPAHTVPTIVDDGFVLWESRAILQYLCNQYAPDSSLYPKDAKKRAIVDRWLNFDLGLNASQKAALTAKLLTGIDAPEDKLIAYKNNLKVMDQLIGDSKYLAGDELTIADLSVLAISALLDVVQFDISDYPNYKRWLSALKSELPYYKEINHFDEDYVKKMVEKAMAKYNLKQ